MSQPASRPPESDTPGTAGTVLGVGEPSRPPRLAPPPRPDAATWTMVEYRDWLLGMCAPAASRMVGLLDAVGQVLCDDIDSPVSLPPFDNSQMDGFAVRADDVAAATAAHPVALRVQGVVNAGDAQRPEVTSGTAVRVMTGAPLPPGADAVVPFELCDAGSRALDAAVVRVVEPVAPAQNVRRTGSDVTAGERLVDAGTRLDARHVGLLAGCGVARVGVHPRPRVLVLSTGAELVEPGKPLDGPARIHDANSFLVTAAAREAGASVTRLSAATDDPGEVAALLAAHLREVDLVVTTGGISEGDADVVKQVLPALGDACFVRVAMQPGKPQGFALLATPSHRTLASAPRVVPVVALPGNPVSSYVSFHAFVRPLLRRLMGLVPEVHEPVMATLEAGITSIPGRMQFARGILTAHAVAPHDQSPVRPAGGRSVRLAGGHGSHLLGDLARSNALVLVPAEVEQVATGEGVECWPLGAG